ncbi:MAG: S8 family serine peptidase, partial [Burkholderiales bacterium]|nr:S8 family serine peptidase [Anaerolineae bacterium]
IAGTPIPQEPVAGQVILRFGPDTSQQEREDYIASIGGTVTANIDAIDTVVVELPTVPSASAQSLPDSPLVVEQESDYFVVALQDGAPNDPRYTEQWALPAIGAPQAWVTLNNVNSIRIAVIDSGVCADHPDLAGRIVAGWDFVQGDDTPQDEFGHGCNIAGVIAANMNDDIGIAGVAPNAQIMPLRILDAHGIGRYSDVAAAVVYAADHDAQIINLSVGGVNASDMLEDAIDYAIGKGITVIAAAGNAGTEQVLYPAAYAPVIAVGSIGRDLQRSSFSNYGAGVDVYAPGSDILTTTRSGGYGSVSGTSFAAPHVAAAAALEIARGGTLTLGGTLAVSGIDSTPPTAAPTQIVAPTATIASETPPVTVDTNQLYYYYEDQRIPLTISSDWIAVRFDSSDLNAQAQVAAQGAGSTVSALANFADAVQIPNPPLTLVPLNSGVGPLSVVALVNSLRASDDVQWANPVFDSQTGDAILTEQFIAQFNGSASDADIAALNTQHGVEIVQPLVGVSNGYILRVTEASDHDALAMANLYHESSLTVYAEPNFVQYMPPLATANDSLFGSQWAFN